MLGSGTFISCTEYASSLKDIKRLTIFDFKLAGHEMVIIKGGQRVCGSGCALGNAPLVQNKSYFEVKLQQGGVWAVGVATRETDLNRVHGKIGCL